MVELKFGKLSNLLEVDRWAGTSDEHPCLIETSTNQPTQCDPAFEQKRLTVILSRPRGAWGVSKDPAPTS